MNMTEAEAKMRWCPFTFGAPSERGPDGSGIREGGPWHCCTTLCMAWQRDNPHKSQARKRGSDVWETWSWDPRTTGSLEDYSEYEFRDCPPDLQGGHCGLVSGHR
jgi:hypothetical protein